MTTLTIVLPVEANATGTATLAPGVGSFSQQRFGVVDNGLWRAMSVFTDLWDARVTARGGREIEVVPFDHLATDFADQQRALGPFGQRVRGVVTGLGN